VFLPVSGSDCQLGNSTISESQIIDALLPASL
jgi:hypothetical protein